MNKRFKAIAAIDLNRGLGFQNKLICYDKEDISFFKQITTGSTVVMGRKTFDSIGKPLPRRKNIIISSAAVATSDVEIVPDPCKYNWSNIEGEIFIIGGSQIYKLFLPYIDCFYITQFFHAAPEADIFLTPVEEQLTLSEIVLDRPTFQIQKWLRLENK